MEIAGLPVHPLVVHAAVTLVPVSAVAAVSLAILPRWRWLTRWPTAGLAVVAAAVSWLSRLSGDALLDERSALLGSGPVLDEVARHQELGELLSLSMLAFALVVVLAAWSLAGTSALASGRGEQRSRLPALERVLPAVLVLASVGVLVLVVLTGDSGARAVWG